MQTKMHEPLRWLHQMVVRGASVEHCIDWPGARRTGYGLVWRDGRTQNANRVALILATGKDPKHLDAAHNCGRRSCVNPSHLRWATRIDNCADRKIHGTNIGPRGTKSGHNKLTEEQVLHAYSDPRSTAAVAREMDVSEQTIRNIRKGRAWSWLTVHGKAVA